MKLEETKLVKLWQETAKVLNGDFSMPFQLYNGGNMNGGIFLFCIRVNYRTVEVKIEAGILELPLSKNEINGCLITISAQKKTNETIHLSIWRKDFFDKILGLSSLKTGYDDFDRVIGLKASRNIERIVPKMFDNKELRLEIQNESLRVYNISTNDNFVTIRRKSGLIMQNTAMIENEYEKFRLFLDGVIDAKIL